MSNLLDHLGKDTLPQPMLQTFVRWCVLEQGRSALVTVLTDAAFDDVAGRLKDTDDVEALAQLGKQVQRLTREKRDSSRPLAISAAEAAAFEFTNMLKAAHADDFDAEAVAFFSARVCGWAHWVHSGFASPQHKQEAEDNARQQQEAQLQTLWKKHGTQQS